MLAIDLRSVVTLPGSRGMAEEQVALRRLLVEFVALETVREDDHHQN